MSIIRRLNKNLFNYYNKSVNTGNSGVNSVWKMNSVFQFSSVDSLVVEHNPKKHQFFVRLGRDSAVLDYRDVSPGVVDLFHTEVPNALQGKGIAKLLAQEAFDYVIKNDIKMIVSCSYLQKYLKDNQKPEYLLHLFQTQD